MNNNQHSFEGKNIVTGYDKKIIIDGVDITIPSNKISVIIGSNGCGKSTLLKTLARLIKPISGDIVIDGKKVTSMPSKQLAKVLGLLPQSPVVPEGITVWDLVSRGRFPYQTMLKSMSKEDFEAVEEALEIMGITDLANRCVDELSGGQRQRVWIAMALAQQTDILLLDEPTTYLDIAYQVEILDLLTDLNRRRNTTIVMVLHDINQAIKYSHNIVIMKNGSIVNEGSPSKIINENIIKDVYQVEGFIGKDEDEIYFIPRKVC